MASFGYERERGQKPAPGAAEPEARHRAEEGELWPSLSLSPETPSGEPGAERSNYFGADAWKPSSSLWYFDGESHPPGDPLPTEVTLTADTHPAGHFDWSVVEGG